MKASETNILKFMEGSKQFQIPIYQREYKWTNKHCKELMKNIKEIMNEEIENHFIGSVVYIQDGIYQSSTIPIFFIIDGQQRITTISLLLLAIAKLNRKIKDKIYDLYLINKYDENNKYKLLSKENDHKVYVKLLENLDLDDDDKTTAIYKNYMYFLKEIESEETAHEIFNILYNIYVVDVALDRNNDDPQKIFESLNSTGLKLKQSDMIRNFLLMSFEGAEQKNIYNNHWMTVQLKVGENYLDNFFRDFLTALTYTIPNKNNVFNDFKEYVKRENSKGNTSIEILKLIHKYSLYYGWILHSEDTKWIRELKSSVSYPFLLRIKHKFEKDEIDNKALTNILNLVESYIFRRKICGVPTNSLNKTFAKLGDINELLDYESYKRFPTDDEFKESLKKDIYGLDVDRYMLNKIENYYSKIEKNVESSSIEHIIPKTITDEWKKELGENWEEIYKKYCHRLGNLTLSEHNSEIGNKCFKDKLKYYKKSSFSINNYFRENEFINGFNEHELLKREEKLIDECLKIWQNKKVNILVSF